MWRPVFSKCTNGRLLTEEAKWSAVRYFASETTTLPEIPKPSRSGLQASFPRGSGGRLSFSGNVCTVFGASGFLGMYVVNSLAKDGTQIILPYRADPYDIRHLKTIGELGQVLFFPFNLKDDESIRKVVRYSNVVVNMIGRDFHTPNYSMNGVNADGARRIARICREMNVKRLIHFSAMNADENPTEYFIPGGSEFLRSKALGEKYVREEFPEAIIVRPSDVFGFMDRFLFVFVDSWRRALGSRIALFRKGNETFKAPVHCFNIGEGVAQLVKDPTHDGKTFEFCGPHWYLLGDFVDWLYRLVHRESFIYGRHNIDFFFSLKCNLLSNSQIFTRRQVVFNWEAIERTEVMSDLLTGCQTLEDLGVTLNVVEDKFSHTNMLKMFDRKRYYKPEIGEFPDPPLPRRYSPMFAPRDVKLSEKYETVIRPTLQAAL